MRVLALDDIIVFPLCARIRHKLCRLERPVGFHLWWIVDFKVCDLRSKTCCSGLVHTPTRFCQFNRQIQIGLFFLAPFACFLGFCNGLAAGGSQGDGARHEADEVIHFGVQHAVETAGSLGEDCKMGFLRIGDQVLSDAREGLIPEIKVYGLGIGGLEILFDEIFCCCQVSYWIGEGKKWERYRSKNLLDYLNGCCHP